MQEFAATQRLHRDAFRGPVEKEKLPSRPTPVTAEKQPSPTDAMNKVLQVRRS